VNTYAEFLADPQVQAAGAVEWKEQVDVGRVPLAVIPAAPRLGEGAAGQAPSIGQHSVAVLAELGYDTRAVEALIETGVVVAPTLSGFPE
jgi:crotonobetainyl-CoA:carnitine CoA-transferase CaiB-like acyl-CoA transferase